jgi:SOS-response transcriptional repressor LexA
MTLDDALLAFYRLTERYEGIPPTVRQFQEEIGAHSTSVAAHWFGVLEEDGLIYCPLALRSEERTARTRKLSRKGLQRAYLLTEAVA